jgi:hypothetical protein
MSHTAARSAAAEPASLRTQRQSASAAPRAARLATSSPASTKLRVSAAIPLTSRGNSGKKATLEGPLGSNQYPRSAIERYQPPSQPAQGIRDEFFPSEAETCAHELEGAIRLAMAPVT